MKRYSIRTLLVVTTVVAVFLGYSRWRRDWLFEEVKQLNALNIRVSPSLWFEHIRTLPELHVRDGFWQVVMAQPPTNICFVKRENGDYVFPGDKETYEVRELRNRLSELQRRLNAVGLEVVEFREYSWEGNRTVQSSTSDLNEVGVGTLPKMPAPRARVHGGN